MMTGIKIMFNDTSNIFLPFLGCCGNLWPLLLASLQQIDSGFQKIILLGNISHSLFHESNKIQHIVL